MPRVLLHAVSIEHWMAHTRLDVTMIRATVVGTRTATAVDVGMCERLLVEVGGKIITFPNPTISRTACKLHGALGIM